MALLNNNTKKYPATPPTNTGGFQSPTYNFMTDTQARTQAGSQLNGQYAIQLQNAMNQVKNQSMGSGFYGQLPQVQMSADTAAQVEAQKQQAIAQLAEQLKQVDQERYNTLYDRAMQTYQTNYQRDRDRVADEQWQKQFDLAKKGGSGGGGGGSRRRSSGGGSKAKTTTTTKKNTNTKTTPAQYPSVKEFYQSRDEALKKSLGW